MNQPIPLRPDPHARREAAVTSIARACLTKARGAHERFTKSDWPQDHVAGLITRGAQTPTSIADAAALATTAVYFVASLVPVSAAAAVISRSLQLSFDGAAVLSIPSLTLPSASFVAEGAAIPVIQGSSAASVTVEPHKLACMLALTNELVRHSNAEAVMRQVLLESVGPTLDQALFSAAAAVPGLRPPGVLSGIAPVAPSPSTAPLDAMVADLGALAGALAPVVGGGEPVLIAAPAQAAALALRAESVPWDVFTSAALPAGTVIGIVPAALATVIEAPRIEAGAGTVHTANPASDIVTAAGVLSAPSISLWQSDEIGIRLILPTAWALRAPSGVAWVASTKW